NIVRQLKADGVTIILTTHYIEEAEAIADRVGVISGGKLLLAEDKATLMTRMGSKQLRIMLHEAMAQVPDKLADYKLALAADGMTLTYAYDTKRERTGIRTLLNLLDEAGVGVRDIETHQSSLEEIFVDLVEEADS
ncbi:MAG: multidrug ABC transporter ATP-binding protein, partial [Alphaproteobacteria bacterium]